MIVDKCNILGVDDNGNCTFPSSFSQHQGK